MNYYNEHDLQAAAWLQNQIDAGLIPAGTIDTRSIHDVTPNDLLGFTQCHFFAGIGGWSHALELAGWDASRPCWTGSCPCQPFSAAGKGLGAADERHLWPVFFELVRQCRPEFVFGEQVANAIGQGWLDGVSADLESAGYACGATVLGAHSVGSAHLRQRLYWVADAQGERCGEAGSSGGRSEKRAGDGGESLRMADLCGEGLEERGEQLARDEQSAAVRSGDLDGVGNAECDGLRGSGGGATELADESGAGALFWSDWTLIQCRDGKVRRIPTEPAFFPLAYGVPRGGGELLPRLQELGVAAADARRLFAQSGRYRVGALRGYGNAIVPEVAAEFVRAFVEVRGTTGDPEL